MPQWQHLGSSSSALGFGGSTLGSGGSTLGSCGNNLAYVQYGKLEVLVLTMELRVLPSEPKL